MAKRTVPKTIVHKFDASVENILTGIYTQEWDSSTSNQADSIQNFESTIDMFEGNRPVKDYEWYSNLSLKQGTSILLTDASTSVNQYFQSRDFVEVYLEGDDPDDEAKARAAKKCINKTLNSRRLNHYLKFTRAKNINNMASHVYALCYWEQDVEHEKVGSRTKWVENGTDEFGRILWEAKEEDVTREIIKTDRFDYDVFDNRNVAVSDEYTYSVQNKRYVTFRTETYYEYMVALAKKNGYINLDAVKEGCFPPSRVLSKSTTSQESYNKGRDKDEPSNTAIKFFDLYTRYGKEWAVVEERTDSGIPMKVKPGRDEQGNIEDDAELVEMITAWVTIGSQKVLVRFDPTPNIDSRGNPYKPIARGICYPHPTKDTGLGEGELLLDLDGAINDSFNLAFDTAKLKTIPVTVSDKFAAEDNDTIFFEPGHNIAIEGGKKAFEMLEVKNSLQDMMGMLAMVKNHATQVTATYPGTMGNLGDVASSTTATAFSGTTSQANLRQNFKSITFEYTFLIDFYWIILQMVWAFARPKTAVKLMGEDVFKFDPDADYTYTPVSSSIETEFSKFRKIQIIQQLMQTVSAIPNPRTPVILNKLMEMTFEILGPDFDRARKARFDQGAQGQALAMMNQGGGQGSPQGITTGGTSNQSGNPMSMGEMDARQAMDMPQGMGS